MESESDGGEELTDGEGGMTDEEGQSTGSRRRSGSNEGCNSNSGSGIVFLEDVGSGEVLIPGASRSNKATSPRRTGMSPSPSRRSSSLSSSSSASEESTATELLIENRTHARNNSASANYASSTESGSEESGTTTKPKQIAFYHINLDEDRKKKEKKDKKDKTTKKKEKKERKERKDKPVKSTKLISPRGTKQKAKDSKEIKDHHEERKQDKITVQQSAHEKETVTLSLPEEDSDNLRVVSQLRPSAERSAQLSSPPLSPRHEGSNGPHLTKRRPTESTSEDEQRLISTSPVIENEMDKAFGADDVATTPKGLAEELTGSSERPVRIRRSLSGGIPCTLSLCFICSIAYHSIQFSSCDKNQTTRKQ